jgi:hypothetical protein
MADGSMAQDRVLRLDTRSTPEAPSVLIRVPVAIAGEIVGNASITWSSNPNQDVDPDLTLKVTLPDGRTFDNTDWDMFECLLQLRRRQLDRLGVRVCCNGSRINAWASGMLRAGGGGLDVYLMEIGRDVTSDDIVPTFHPAPVETIGTAEDQICFNERWAESLAVLDAGQNEG